ncbi:hypothetical protein RM549_11135 [Salegentibacter sp. F188]|uniref:YD repeat-containing protein n=1 Tax=Autumnicola patrickiae TaxID=3075591 RepID=A0ABU3E526_9FLAO|nr:hypothetical protein [Salegentibacter sp. F188]MDT0690342.1 hypothetical protein [Salegentibacter sp. F188]
MKKVFSFVFLILCIACSDDGDNPSSEKIPDFSKVKEIVYWIPYGTNDTTVLIEREYTIEAGFVTEADYGGDENIYFEYDEEGRLIEVNGDGSNSLDYGIIWNGEKCTISTSYSTTNLIYKNGNLFEIEVNHEEGSRSIYQKRNFEFSGENVIAAYLNDTLQFEYLDYHPNVVNPLYYLKSIEPWRATIVNNPFSKNIFYTRREQPYSGDDYFSPLRDYQYNYLIKDQYRVESISSNWSIYNSRYEFYE